MAMTKKKKTIIKVSVITLVVILAGLMTFGGVCMHLMNQDNIRDKYTLVGEDDSFLGTMLKGALRGSDFDLTELQVNTYINKTFCSDTGFLRKARVYFHKDAPVEIYGKILHWNKERAVYAKADLELLPEKGVVAVRLSDVKLGELKIHSHAIEPILRDFAKSTPLAEYTDGVLYVRTEYSYSGKNFSLTLKLEKLEPSEGIVTCRTNSLTKELIVAVKDYLLSDDGKEYIRNIIGEGISKAKDFLLDLIF